MTGDLDRQASGVDADRGQRTTICEATLRHATTATTTESGLSSSSIFSFESFLEISLRLPKSRYGNRFRFSLFIEICFGLFGFQNGSRFVLAMSRESLFWRMLFQFLVQFFTLPPTDIK